LVGGVGDDKGSNGNFRILDLSGSDTHGNWTKSSKPGLMQGVSSPARFSGKKAVSAVGLNSGAGMGRDQWIPPADGRASSRSEKSREGKSFNKKKGGRYQLNRNATKKQIKPFNSKEKGADPAQTQHQIFEDRFYGHGKSISVNRMNLCQEQAALKKSDDENIPIKDLDDPEQVKEHKRVKSMESRQLQAEKWQRLSQKMPTATKNNAYHVDSVHLSVLNNMAPFLQNTIYEKKIEKTTCKVKVEEISSFQTHALGMKSFFDEEIQKVLSDGVT
jgi:hypothetical protein